MHLGTLWWDRKTKRERKNLHISAVAWPGSSSSAAVPPPHSASAGKTKWRHAGNSTTSTFLRVIMIDIEGHKVLHMKSTSVYAWPLAGIGTLPPPLSPASVPLPPEPKGGGGHTGVRVRGWGSPSFKDWRKSLALCLLCVEDPLSYCSSAFRLQGGPGGPPIGARALLDI